MRQSRGEGGGRAGEGQGSAWPWEVGRRVCGSEGGWGRSGGRQRRIACGGGGGGARWLARRVGKRVELGEIDWDRGSGYGDDRGAPRRRRRRGGACGGWLARRGGRRRRQRRVAGAPS
jgi:hypothetical protein